MSTNQLDDVINQLVPVVKPIVDSIESKLPTTKDRYDAYMTAITTLADKIPGNQKSIKLGIAFAMTKAGGNRNGILAALRVMGEI